MKQETVFFAVRKKATWDKNQQFPFFGNQEQINQVAKMLALSGNEQVRVSKSKGYNNQGYYYDPSEFEHAKQN